MPTTPEQWSAVKSHVQDEWDNTIVSALSAYIEVPNQSRDFDPEWATNGLMMKAFHILHDWVKAQPLKGATVTLVDEIRETKRTPFMLVQIEATNPPSSPEGEKTCLMYGHMDKQPPLLPWDEGLHPHKAVLTADGKLYGRGGADDGYSIFMAIASIVALQKQGIPHGRIAVMMEADEETSSIDLDYYIGDRFKTAIGDVDLVVCLDAGGLSYEHLWLTTSLRGVTGGVLTIETLKEGSHSGIAGGVVPDTFQVLRVLLDRLEDPLTGEMRLEGLKVQVPTQTLEELQALNNIPFKDSFALLEGTRFLGMDGASNAELAVRNFWEPCMTVVGADLPSPAEAGNVIRQKTCCKISVRLPPTVNAEAANKLLKETIEKNPPFGAKVSFLEDEPGAGWAAPPLKPWLRTAVDTASREYFDKPYGGAGLGGSIPLMGMLGDLFPEAQFLVTGVLGPKSNAHGPNEFISIPFAKGINYCVAKVLAAHGAL